MKDIQDAYLSELDDLHFEIEELKSKLKKLQQEDGDNFLHINKEILLKAIEKWGREIQINKLQEEALELSLVLNQRNCPTKDAGELEESLYDELADMKIMMAQAEILFNADRINERVKFKLEKFQSKYLI